jgi:hypothetical protein
MHLVSGHERDVDAFASQFTTNRFADADAAARHDRMLALQSEVHGILSPSRRDRDFIGTPRIVLSEGLWRKGCQTKRDEMQPARIPSTDPPPPRRCP